MTDGVRPTERWRVGIVSASPILCEGLAVILEAEHDLACEAVVGDLASASALLLRGKLDALVAEESVLEDPTKLGELRAVLETNREGRVVVLASSERSARFSCEDERQVRVLPFGSAVDDVVDALRELFLRAGP